MSQKVLILGNSGTGKSASMRNFDPEEIFVINSAGKTLPFKNHFEQFTPTFETLPDDVLTAMESTTKKVIVIDDCQYIMSFPYMRRIHENGWEKWNDIQGDFFNILKAADNLSNDTIVYFLSHITTDENGNEKIKTMGKMLDEKITIEGLFTIVLKTIVQDGKYYFATQNSGRDTVKSPIGMFDNYAIENDLKYVDEKIRNYYEMTGAKSDADIEAMDEQKTAVDVEKPEEGRKRRRRAADPEPVTEAPKVRQRKERNTEPEETPSEKTPTEETAPEEQPRKRRTRRKDKFVNADPEDVPFEE